MKIYLASGNRNKLAELSTMMERLPVEFFSADEIGGMPDVEESADTLKGNAHIKAAALLAHAPDDTWVLSDDSGLFVDALGGVPGVRSARFAGEDADDAQNNTKLLQALKGKLPSERSAEFRCYFCIMCSNSVVYFEGICRGQILQEAKGTAGFGYDPIFVPEGYNETFAELGSSVKNTISHRAKACQLLYNWLDAKSEK